MKFKTCNLPATDDGGVASICMAKHNRVRSCFVFFWVITCLALTSGAALASEVVYVDKLMDPDGQAGDKFGSSVSVAAETMVIGALGMGLESGSVVVYERNSFGGWDYKTKLVNPSGEQGEQLGWSVSVDADVIVAGAPFISEEHSYVSVFERNAAGEWNHAMNLVDPDGSAYDYFGRSVSVSGDIIAVGNPSYNDAGSVVVFERVGPGEWDYRFRIDATDPMNDFGESVQVVGDSIYVGSPGDDIAAADDNKGSVSIFMRDGDTWPLEDKLIDATLSEHANLGSSIHVDGDYMVAGAISDVINDVMSQGSALVFERNTEGNWEKVDKIVDPDGEAFGNFGNMVSLSVDTIVAGVNKADERTGAAIVFERNELGEWNYKTRLMAEDGVKGDYYGWSVSMFGDTLVIGAINVDQEEDLDVGAAYLYRLQQVPGYKCVGFSPPVADSPLRLRRNQAIPLRAELQDADGVPITGDDLAFTNPPVVQAWYYSENPNDPNNTEEPLDYSGDVLPMGEADKGNQFYFVETDTGYWQFILDGRVWSASGWYQVMMDSGSYSDYMIAPTCMAQFVIE
jgi:hypothetical protein